MKRFRRLGIGLLGCILALLIAGSLSMHWLCLVLGQLLRSAGTILLNLAFILHASSMRAAQIFDRKFYP